MAQKPSVLTRIRKRIELRTKFLTPTQKRATEAQRAEESRQAYERGYPDRSK